MAYVLNPKLGHKTSVLEEKEIMDDLKTVLRILEGGQELASMLIMVRNFLTKTQLFHESYIYSNVAKDISVQSWWETWTTDSDVGAVRSVALRVFARFATCSTSSASERNFSIWGLIHSKSRNRLYNDKLEKLVYNYQSMRVLRKIKTPAGVSRTLLYTLIPSPVQTIGTN